eukprot:UN02100
MEEETERFKQERKDSKELIQENEKLHHKIHQLELELVEENKRSDEKLVEHQIKKEDMIKEQEKSHKMLLDAETSIKKLNEDILEYEQILRLKRDEIKDLNAKIVVLKQGKVDDLEVKNSCT